MAHGFHFYNSLEGKLIGKEYYFLEKLAAKYTDAIITINNEDYKNAQMFKLKKKDNVFLLNLGVGINLKKYQEISIDVTKKKKEIGVNDDSIILLSVGELNENKNHLFVIEKLEKEGIFNAYPTLKYIICGEGRLRAKYENYIKEHSLEGKVVLLGFRYDINEILKISKIFIFPSIREGLPSSIIEAMASGLPIICSDIRGNRDLVETNKNGFLFKLTSDAEFSTYLNSLLENELEYKRISENNKEKSKNYDCVNARSKILRLFNDIGLGDGI